MSKRRKIIEDTISYIHTYANSKAEIRYRIRLMLYDLECLRLKEQKKTKGFQIKGARLK